MRKQRFRNVGAGKGVKQRLQPDVLQGHLDDGLSQTEIALLHGCTPQFISLLVHEYGLESRSAGERDGRPRGAPALEIRK